MSSIDSKPAGVTLAPTTPPKKLDFDPEAEIISQEPIASIESPTVSPTTTKKKKQRNVKKKKTIKGKGDLTSSDFDDLPPLAKKSSPNKLSVNTKVGSSIPLHTPADYQDMDALDLNFSVLWDYVNWSNKEVGLSVDDLVETRTTNAAWVSPPTPGLRLTERSGKISTARQLFVVVGSHSSPSRTLLTRQRVSLTGT